MGKSDANQTKKRSHKAKATDGEIKHKNKPSVDAMTFEDTDNDGGLRHSQWRDLFRQLCEYKVQFGDCLVPQRYSTNPKLGKWVDRQRTRYRNNTEEEESTSTAAEQIRALNGIGFDWGTSQTGWSVRFQQLCEFTAQFSHCIVPIKYSANPKLGRWVSNQRNHYRLYQERKPSPLTEDRIRELESVGFEWKTSAFIWNEGFQQLREFKVQFGHCIVPFKYSANPKLGQWVSTQRRNYRLYQEEKPSHMTGERIRELNGIGFDWGTSQTDWSVRFQQLCKFTAQFSHCSVPIKYSANPKLGRWVSNQRNHYRLYQERKPSPLTEDRIRMEEEKPTYVTVEQIRALNGIGFDWGTSQTDWSVRFQQLCEFKEQFGHCLVPQQYAANPKLRRWVDTQRRNYRLYQERKPSHMTEDRIRDLESVGFEAISHIVTGEHLL